jgi:hypothetical protein
MSLAKEYQKREQLKILGCIIGYHIPVFTARKIKRFLETDGLYPLKGRIKSDVMKDYWRYPLKCTFRTLVKQGCLEVRRSDGRTTYEVENWRKLEDFYHEILSEYCSIKLAKHTNPTDHVIMFYSKHELKRLLL